MNGFENDILKCIEVLQSGGIILYPTDTVWGIGCDATNEAAVKKIYDLKQRDDAKSMIVLLGNEQDLLQYIAAPDPMVFDYIAEQTRPTTFIFQGAIGFAENVLAVDGSVALRISRDEFNRHLIKRFRKPIVSTSANISGEPTPASFSAISDEIKNGVDYVVQWRQQDETPAQPSRIIAWEPKGSIKIIRE